MKPFFSLIVRYRKAVLALYAVLIVICAYASTRVKVNADLSDYLPQDADSTIALHVMEAEFGGDIANAQLMVRDVSLTEAKALRDRLVDTDGVLEVMWVTDTDMLSGMLDMPLSALPDSSLSSYYKDGCALYDLTIDNNCEAEVLDRLRALTDKETHLAGSFVDGKVASGSSFNETMKSVALIVVFAVFLLIATLDSWVEPFLLVICLVGAVMLNLGSNLLLGTISYVTNIAAGVLQMGVSADYSIFILHRYKEYKESGLEAPEAMVQALTHSVTSVASSAVTTIIGFAALSFMRYRIGMDMGIVLSKGVAFSLIAAFTLLPCVTVLLEKLIARTRHKPLIGEAKKLSALSERVRVPAAVCFAVVLAPAILMQANNRYYYGSSHMYKEDHVVMRDREAIHTVFGADNLMVLLVPKGSAAKETALIRVLKRMPELNGVTSYTEMLGPGIPAAVLPSSYSEMLMSERYSRVVLRLAADSESEETFALIDRILAAAKEIYGEDVHAVGESVSTYDLKKVISADSVTVNAIAAGAIFVVLMISFRSVILPAILTLSIEGAIWICMAISYLMGTYLFYMGYLIVSAILLGSTVDYAILVTSRFLEFRKEGAENAGAADGRETGDAAAGDARRTAMREAVTHSGIAVMTSGLILSVAGLFLNLFCTNQLAAQLGFLLSRGTLIAMAVVLFVLPAYLLLYDRLRRGR